MSRSARFDAVGLLQHVMVRGIEKRDIFLDDQDRRRFLSHFSDLLIKTQTACLAWSLMTNHLHLLLRPQKMKLSRFMMGLLTSYATGFNLRHNRVGHLFQNRYKSIVCEVEPYLQELVRYIHLNPLRGGLVESVYDLEKYPWSGHAVLMGEADLAGQATAEVLSLFGPEEVQAREKYRAFLIDGVEQGRLDELSTEGEIRGLFMAQRIPGEEAYDLRVLGSGEFVEQLWDDEEQEVTEPRMALSTLLQEVATTFGLQASTLCHPNKSRPVSRARAVICYLGQRELGYSGVSLARLLGITGSAVTTASNRGEEIVKDPDYQHLLLKIRIFNS